VKSRPTAPVGRKKSKGGTTEVLIIEDYWELLKSPLKTTHLCKCYFSVMLLLSKSCWHILNLYIYPYLSSCCAWQTLVIVEISI